MYRGQPRKRGGNSSNPGGRGGRTSNQSSSQPRGVFASGVWHCDCTPRLPAEHFRVKKEGPNKGKWFYTCQKADPHRCGFFLWDDDAKVREEAAVLDGKRTEPGVQEGWNAGRERDAQDTTAPPGKGLFASNGREVMESEDKSTASPSPPPAYSTNASQEGGVKRPALDAGLEDQEFGLWELGDADEMALAVAADAAPPSTPDRAQKHGVYATPAATTGKRKLPWLEQSIGAASTSTGDEHSQTPSRASVHDPPAVSRISDPQTPTGPAAQMPSTATTPSPSTRHRDALMNPADDASSLTFEVLASLSTVRIPSEALSKVRSILSKHDLKTQGIKKGRDISRLALKAKDAKIVELQARIASLEADREVERGLGRYKKWDSGQSGSWEG